MQSCLNYMFGCPLKRVDDSSYIYKIYIVYVHIQICTHWCNPAWITCLGVLSRGVDDTSFQNCNKISISSNHPLLQNLTIDRQVSFPWAAQLRMIHVQRSTLQAVLKLLYRVTVCQRAYVLLLSVIYQLAQQVHSPLTALNHLLLPKRLPQQQLMTPAAQVKRHCRMVSLLAFFFVCLDSWSS